MVLLGYQTENCKNWRSIENADIWWLDVDIALFTFPHTCCRRTMFRARSNAMDLLYHVMTSGGFKKSRLRNHRGSSLIAFTQTFLYTCRSSENEACVKFRRGTAVDRVLCPWRRHWCTCSNLLLDFLGLFGLLVFEIKLNLKLRSYHQTLIPKTEET